MDAAFITEAANLGGTVFTVVAFLWYLKTRDLHWTEMLKDNSKSSTALARALQRLTDIIERNSQMSVTNTAKVTENVAALKENTTATVESTEVVKANGNH